LLARKVNDLETPAHDIPLYWRTRFHEQFQTENFSFIEDNVLSHWHQVGDTYFSGFHGPFGGFYSEKIREPRLKLETIKNCLNYLKLKSENNNQVTKVRIRLFPEKIFPYPPSSQLSGLKNVGFVVDFSDTAHYILLGEKWRDSWRRNRKRDFKKSIEKITELQVKYNGDVSEIYELISRNAGHKNRKFSLTAGDYNRMLTVLSGEELDLWIYKSVSTGDSVAAAICQIVDYSVVYVFRWGHVYNYKDHGLESSPMTFVADQLCQEYSNRGFKVLYIGTSSYEGVLDENLAHFKESLGALRTSIESVSLKSSR
jgi:hypothetical protein